ncbi:hypothetical protein [Synoicihabitans lomoniglobus]|uniref:Uncharacterized protein n=1 Tax=Synoicihabitans lomoniglobus TaxID=2909285 RepID=A0AAE9ZUJ7_9BACT|nr:hypothetical protein [Opitutaceae bacterium LMO-M01]WED64362.1 hypothetical protein PXH66_18645 [Opitutaceae bacterium LMO-M01]
MSQPETVEFVLKGSIAGHRVSALEGVPFNRFVEFNEDVQKYVQGSDNKTVLQDVRVQVHEGSYLLRVLIPAGLLASLLSDSARIGSTGSLSDIDANRAKVLLRWQQRSQAEPDLTFTVRSPRGAFPPVLISQASNFQREERVLWVNAERYLIGEITDWGGSQNPNVHLRLRNTRETLIVDATADQIREQRDNLVFHKAIVHVRAKQNPATGELKDYKLIELRAYAPDVEDARLDQLFAAGAKAWAGVPDGGAWVEELRGGSGV